ncbi:MAG: SGNH hydrolase domain-containing protein, partial [Myxococcota bacterium]
AERHGESVRFLGYSGMPPLVGARLAAGEGAREGHRYNDAAVAYILGDPSVRTVLLAARWARYVVGPVEDFGAEPAGWGGFGPTLLREGRRPSGEADALDAFAAHLRETVARLRAAGRRVVVVGPIPELGVEAPRALALLLARGQDPAGLVLPAASFEARQRGVLAALDALRDVERVNPHTRLRAGDGYGLLADGRPLYQDDDHLSLAGAARVSPAFDAVFAEEPAAIGTEAGRRATRD